MLCIPVLHVALVRQTVLLALVWLHGPFTLKRYLLSQTDGGSCNGQGGGQREGGARCRKGNDGRTAGPCAQGAKTKGTAAAKSTRDAGQVRKWRGIWADDRFKRLVEEVSALSLSLGSSEGHKNGG